MDYGRYHFLPWLRRGIGTAITNVDADPLPARAQLDVVLTISSTLNGVVTTSNPPDTKVALYGPGDVIGIDPHLVVRTEPHAATANFEPNYLAGIDFGVADFPWLFTPAINKGDRLRPWIALIVLKNGEFKEPSPQTVPLPSVGITNIAALQDLSENWSWAHVQVSTEGDVTQTLQQDPGHVISRLLCPRRLDPETSYDALLVPAFDIGRRAGLGIDISGVTTSDAAWTSTTPASNDSPYPIPYYYRFSFHTSDGGDFESLVRLLQPLVLPPDVGIRPIAVDQPGPHIPSAGPPLGLEGALIRVGTEPTTWNDPDKTNFQSALQTLLNLTTPTIDDPAHPNPNDPRVVPPIYARWHAGITTVDRTKSGWLNDLNLDPRWRVPGGFGTEVVQTKRTALLASAWQQVARVIAANRLLRQAQLARAAMVQLYRNQLQPALATTLLRWTAPIHAKILGSPQTVLAQVRASRLPQRILSGAFRRVTRPLGPVRRRQGADPTHAASLLNGVNDGTLEIVPPAKPPAGTVSIDQVSNQLSASFWSSIPLPLWLIVLIAFFLGLLIALTLGLALLVVAAIAIVVAWIAFKNQLSILLAGRFLRFSNLTTTSTSTIPPRPGFAVTAPGQPAKTTIPSGSGDSPDAFAFRAAMLDLTSALQVAQPVDTVKPPAAIQSISTTVLSRLDPTITIPARLNTVVGIDVTRLQWNPPDPIQPIMAAPSFDTPMYAPLRDLSQNYILPGVGLIPPNSLGLLEANHAFIEAYMVGLNHEMARQLLVNAYPTDQRGSYFRQFWDVSAYVPQPGDPTDPAQLKELLRDIPPINTWPLTNQLGDNENRKSIVLNNLVLVIRGELLRRYPNTIIFAGMAVKDPASGDIVLDESLGAEKNYKHPIFGGTLAPDITFLGFDLTADQALGRDPVAPLGYYFAFQQVPTEPRFGLEPSEMVTPVQYWAELAWTNFATGGVSFELAGAAAKPADVKTTLPNFVESYSTNRLQSTVMRFTLDQYTLPNFVPATTQPTDQNVASGPFPEHNDANINDHAIAWGQDSAQAAYILLRRPFRIMFAAKRMLPQ